MVTISATALGSRNLISRRVAPTDPRDIAAANQFYADHPYPFQMQNGSFTIAADEKVAQDIGDGYQECTFWTFDFRSAPQLPAFTAAIGTPITTADFTLVLLPGAQRGEIATSSAGVGELDEIGYQAAGAKIDSTVFTQLQEPAANGYAPPDANGLRTVTLHLLNYYPPAMLAAAFDGLDPPGLLPARFSHNCLVVEASLTLTR